MPCCLPLVVVVAAVDVCRARLMIEEQPKGCFAVMKGRDRNWYSSVQKTKEMVEVAVVERQSLWKWWVKGNCYARLQKK